VVRPVRFVGWSVASAPTSLRRSLIGLLPSCRFPGVVVEGRAARGSGTGGESAGGRARGGKRTEPALKRRIADRCAEADGRFSSPPSAWPAALCIRSVMSLEAVGWAREQRFPSPDGGPAKGVGHCSSGVKPAHTRITGSVWCANLPAARSVRLVIAPPRRRSPAPRIDGATCIGDEGIAPVLNGTPPRHDRVLPRAVTRFGRPTCSLLELHWSLVFVGLPVKRRGVRKRSSALHTRAWSARPVFPGSSV
jgi:hypothetical protein